MLPPIAPLSDPKRLWRERMRPERRAAAKARPDAARHAATHFISAIAPGPDETIALYYPINDELDTEPLASAFFEAGLCVCLPITAGKKAPLTFRRYEPGDEMVKGSFGEMVPTNTAEEVTPSIVVTPLLAFTNRGDRLGYGGGYYDRTLQDLRQEHKTIAVGYAFGAQEVDALPIGPLDQPLDWVITERGAIRCAAR